MPVRFTPPPPLPSEVLARTVRLASIDGRMVLWLSGTFALFAAMGHEVVGAVAGCAAAGAGAMELHGVTVVRAGESRGLDWMIRAQLLLLATILLYAATRLMTWNPELITERITPDIEDRIAQFQMTREQFLEATKTLYQLVYAVVGFVGLIYQGGMARYYMRRRAIIRQALDEHEPA